MSALFRVILRTQLTRGRVAALAAVGALGLVMAFAIGYTNDAGDSQSAYGLIEGYGLGVLVPITTLVFAAAALGDPAEDGTLVYLWLRPIARSRIALSAVAAAACIAVPFAVVPTVLAAAATRVGADLVVGSLVSSLVAVVAYSGLFLGLGLLVQRALTWGLAYVIIWEGFVARSGTGAARLSILLYARSLLADLADHAPPALAASTPIAITVPLVVGAVSVLITAWLLRRLDVR